VVHPSNRSSGFGLMDIIVTLGVVAVLFAATGPMVLGALRTYERNGAARHVLAEIRRTQSTAVIRRGVYGFHWGGDASFHRQSSEYRIERDAGTCSLPAEAATQDNVSVITGWTDLDDSWRGVRIQSMVDSANQPVNGVMFDSRGRAINNCAAVTYPVTITVADAAGRTRVIDVQLSGGTQLR